MNAQSPLFYYGVTIFVISYTFLFSKLTPYCVTPKPKYPILV